MIVFETPRLIVRELTEMDFPGFHDLQGNINVMRHITGKAHTQEENYNDLMRVIALYNDPEKYFKAWAVERKEDLEFIGTCALIHNGENEYEIGYRFREKYWGKGYAKETIKGLTHYALSHFKDILLVAFTTPENIKSAKVLEATGYHFSGEKYNDRFNCTDLYFVYKQE